MRVALRRGRLELQRASALITSANDALVGNLQPEYWRFEGGINVDGALRATAGPDLTDACLALPALDTEGKRDLVRWTRAVKVHESAVVRCPTGSAVKTTAGSLEADFIVHAVAPDVELTFGRYQGKKGAPEDLLRSAYRSSFKAAADLECVACPALGAGVKGWDPAVTAAFGLEAAARAVRDNEAPRSIEFVLGDDAFAAWARVAATLLGPGDGPAWTINPEDLVVDDVGDVLPLRDVDEICLPRTLWANPENAGTQTTGGAWRWQPGDPRAV